MENKEKETFSYTYSAEQQEEIQNIRKKYTEPQEDKMEQLRRLDASAAKKANRVSIMVGVIGTLIMGVGMSLVMTDIGTVLGGVAMPLGVAIGVIGMALLICAYPLYNKTLKKERERIAPEILKLTDELMK